MLNFNFYSPTRILFGKQQIAKLGAQIKQYSSKILLIYGQESIKKNGLYKDIVSQLYNLNITFQELSGIKPNPSIDYVRQGIATCKKNKLNFILAVGGGSVIDCAKLIAGGFFTKEDPWELMLKKKKIAKALPIGTVLTLTGTGSEMNGTAVISNLRAQEKLTIHSEYLIPKFSILDPTYTFSVSPYHTAAGIADIMSHTMEQYFSLNRDSFLTDSFAESIINICTSFGPTAVSQPANYTARANLMWAASLALNGLLRCGKNHGDWATHQIEHALNAFYNSTHGVGLAILTPAWMDHILSLENAAQFALLGQKIWGTSKQADPVIAAKATITKIKHFFKSLELPESLSAINIKEADFEKIAAKAVSKGKIGSLKILDKNDVLKILFKAK